MSEGLMFLLNTVGALPAGDIHAHLPELASWFVVLAAFTSSRQSQQPPVTLSSQPSSSPSPSEQQSPAVSLPTELV